MDRSWARARKTHTMARGMTLDPVKLRSLQVIYQIFKHHISVIEGHMKMVDMVRKHTVEGSGNWRTIMGCVDRAKEMLQVSKQISRTFV